MFNDRTGMARWWASAGRGFSRLGRVGLLSSPATMSSLRTSRAHGTEDSEGVRHFDYLVIGGGSGGVASARRAASFGAKVALVESAALGGTCVNVGCVPKKVMFNVATTKEVLEHAHHFGFQLSEVSFDWKRIKDARDAYVRRLNGIYATLLKNSGVTVITGEASFTGPRRVKVGGSEYTADHVLIATGGRPAMPDVPGATEYCIDSDGFFALESLPKKVAVVGAGYIAVEMAGILNALGADTSLFVRFDGVLRNFDGMLRETLHKEMANQGLKLHRHSIPAAVEKDEATGLLRLKLKDGSVHEGFDVVLMAVGRKPETGGLNLGATGVEVTERSHHIKADDHQQTSAPGVYALGDVCGKVELTPMAIAAGRRLADRLFGGLEGAKADYSQVPTVVFSHPPIGSVGMTEEQARAELGADKIKVYTSSFVNLYYGAWQVAPEKKPRTAVKIICTGPEERIVGLHVIGMGADEMLQGFAVAVKMGATKADFDRTVAIHPTAAEEFVTLAPWGLSGTAGAPARVKAKL